MKQELSSMRIFIIIGATHIIYCKFYCVFGKKTDILFDYWLAWIDGNMW